LGRNVKGTVFIDYVRMIKKRKDVDWTAHLAPEDLRILAGRIEPGDWYPIDTFERMGLAILDRIAGGRMELVYHWGRYNMDGLFKIHANLIVKGDPMESLMRLHVFRSSFFDFDAVRLEDLMGNEATLKIDYRFSRLAEEASANQTVGFFERLLELSGAEVIRCEYTRKSWESEPPTIVRLGWD
jgi:hypothetical protein